MIYIREDIPKKCPGVTSLFLEFDYNQDIIDIIKRCQLPIWDKKEKRWEIPTSNLSYLLDQLTLIDDVKLELYKEVEKPYIKYQHPENGLIIPFKHQLEAVEYGLNHNKWFLLDVPGLGKTASLQLLAEELYRQGKIEKCLIVCGINSLKRNWERELKKFSNLSCRVIGQHITRKGNVTTKSIPERVKELSQKLEEFFIIVNIESLRSEEILKAINSGPNKYGLICFDESHKCKDPGAVQTHNMIKTKAPYKVAATGTLLLNSPLDSYVALKWLGLENSTYSNFKYYYCVYGGPFNNILEGFKNTEYLKYQIDKNSLRRTKDIIKGLPPKNIIEEYIELDEKQRIFYENVVQGVVHDVKEGIKLNPDNLLAMTTRLRQAIDCPQVLTNEEIPNSKLDRCIDLAEQILSDPNEKLVIMNSFKAPCEQQAKLLQKYNPLICTGDTPDDLVDQYKEMFQNDNEHRVMICTGQKMGTGHSLNRAAYLILFSSPWTESVLTQWEDRIHRVNNTRPAFIYHLWALDTFDMRVKELVDMKGAISDYIVDGVTEAHLNILKRYIEELR